MREYITITNSDGDDLDLPARRVLCPRCNGNGKVCHPAFSEQGISADEWNNEWDDFERNMYLGGGYDIACPECEGRLWVLTVDECSCTPDEMKAYRSHHETMADLEAQERAERRFGC